ncbi:MAG TPA: 23S rRNA (adenine(2030)-N(6))-methyltransferase RlmJ, partial [Rhodopila sp.]|nr:23S rRNA (adenine(2030)-N(6))-methyltransferase RlmJ [Rhodopila sp.]
MNYRHDFHAGNFADCFKHALLVALLDAMARKPAPYFVMDTHAGAGQYDLESEAAQRTREAESGIRRLLAARPAALQRFLELVDSLGLYPGSPALIRALLRPQDRLMCCESQPDVARSLRRLLHADPRVHIHQRSGWEALGALLPPAERRGLVFVDPPFEDPEEFRSMAKGLAKSHERFAHGIFAGWYPIKRLAALRGFYADIGAMALRDIIAVELYLREPLDPSRLNGCGLIVVNPPYLFEAQARPIAEAVLTGLGPAETGAGINILRLA